MSEFPVDSFRDAAPHLRRPFTPAAVKYKPQSVTQSGKTLCVAYIDARLVIERLNLVCPHLWKDCYEPTPAGLMWCHLTIDGITRSDVGEGKGKALVSDALKRAAVHFGVGVPLYAVPQQFIDGQQRFLNDNHQRQLRGAYERWLKQHGIQAFGEPLDHGDSEDSQGDAEAHQDMQPGVSSSGSAAGTPSTSSPAGDRGDATAGRTVASPETSKSDLPDNWVEGTIDRLKHAGLWDGPKLKEGLAAIGVQVPAGAQRKTMLARLDAGQRTAFGEWMQQAGEQALVDSIKTNLKAEDVAPAAKGSES